MEQYRKKNRMEYYDYSTPGLYFVTICTKHRVYWFGNVEKGSMLLNEVGEIAKKYLLEIPNHYNNVELNKWIIMPNHIHVIINITWQNVGTGECPVPTNRYGLLSKIINSYKNVVTKTLRQKLNNHKFNWQRSFHDHIIRNEKSLFNIQNYIDLNPFYGTRTLKIKI